MDQDINIRNWENYEDINGKPAKRVISVDSDGNFINPATSSKQDTLLTELQLKADLTETQPVSIATMPSTPVTGTFWQATQPVSGTVAVTNADMSTVAGAVSATHMQSDIVGALPAGAAKIGDVGQLGNAAADGTGTDYHMLVGTDGRQSINAAQMNGVTVLMGAGNTGTGSQRVTIATDQVAIASKAAINTYVDGSIVTIGAKADAKSTATDTTAITMMSVLKQISASVQAPPSQAVTNAGTFATQETAPTTVLNGKTSVTTAGTRVVLASSTACKSVTIKALTANTGIIYVGNTTVAASNGYALGAGDSISLDIANLTTVNIDSSVNGEGVTYLGVV